jgi:hypothetical protein
MQRRGFLKLLGVGMAGLYLRLAPKLELPPASGELLYPWFQSARSVPLCYSPAYMAALEAIMNRPSGLGAAGAQLQAPYS